MDRHHLARIRCRSTLLAVEGPPPSPVRVVEHLVAVQAQEFRLARWSIGERAGTDAAAVAALLDEGHLLRTHVLRPTWHFVRPADLGWLLDLTGPRVEAVLRRSIPRLGFDENDVARFCAAVDGALGGGRSMTRDELGEVAADAGIVVDRLGLTHLIMYAELRQVVCSGPVTVPAGRWASGRDHTYALLRDRMPGVPGTPGASAGAATGRSVRTRQEALTELVARYFVGHGPATVKDLGWWAGLTLTDVRRGLTDAGDLLDRADVEGRTYWGPPGWTGWPAPRAAAHLLQTFDEMVVGYGDSRAVLDVAGIATMTGPSWGRDGHPVLLDGQVVGHWRAAGRAAGRTAGGAAGSGAGAGASAGPGSAASAGPGVSAAAGPGSGEGLLAVTPCRELTGSERDLVARAAAGLADFLLRRPA